MKTAKHKAVMLFQLEVHPLLESGECSGRPLGAKVLEGYGLKPKMVLTINGFDEAECIKKLKAALAQFEVQ